MSTPDAASTPDYPAAPPGQIVLRIVVTSTRPNRLGPVVADWVRNHAPSDRCTVDVVDLAELNLPLLDEPEMASTGIYHHAHTHRWRDLVIGADALVWVMPEYNGGYPATMKNAVDYLYAEWEGKPMAVVGYGYRGAVSATEQITAVLRRVKASVVDGVAPVPRPPRREAWAGCDGARRRGGARRDPAHVCRPRGLRHRLRGLRHRLRGLRHQRCWSRLRLRTMTAPMTAP